jgi:enoyl-CoA hydratase/carnithine racemase
VGLYSFLAVTFCVERADMLHPTLTHQKEEDLVVIRIGLVKTPEEMTQLSGELRDLCEDITFDPDIRVVVLTGADKNSFSIEAGISLSDSESGEDPEPEIWSLTDPIAKLDLPVIAGITGDTMGQGLELALACDIRIASEAARFALTHIKSGLIPGDGGTQRLSRLVGKGKGIEMILTGEMIDAQEALRIGLVNRIVPSEKLQETAMQMAREMASKGPIAMKYAKEAINKGIDMTLEQGLRLEADLYLLLHTTQDRAEGIQMFQKKGVPQFRGK